MCFFAVRVFLSKLIQLIDNLLRIKAAKGAACVHFSAFTKRFNFGCATAKTVYAARFVVPLQLTVINQALGKTDGITKCERKRGLAVLGSFFDRRGFAHDAIVDCGLRIVD